MTGKARVEAFSDGVMAIAITLLTLNLAVPSEGEAAAPGGLLAALIDRWPNYLAYLAAFLMIGIIWLNHRALVDKVRRFDHVMLWLNLFLLLTVAVLPFPTAVLAAFLRDGGPSAATAASFFGAVAAAMAVAWVLMWRHIRDHDGLMEPGFGRDYAQREVTRSVYGLLVYSASILVALLAPLVAMLGFIGIGVFYGLAREGVGREVRSTSREAVPSVEDPTATEAHG